MKLYWVSLLIQDTEKSKPWLYVTSDGCFSLEKAREIIKKEKSINRVLSAWIDVFDNNIKTTVFHECYVNTMGIIVAHREE